MNETINTDVIVVGGGIGGLAAALALSRIGKKVCVLEQASQFSEIGAGIQLGPNVFRMFERLEVIDDIRAVAAFPDSLMMRDSVTGELVTRIPLGPPFKHRFGFDYAVIHRADIHGVLHDHCRQKQAIRLHTNAKVTQIEETADQVTAITASGQRIAGELLIGADGLWSRIRRHVADDGDPLVSGHIAYRAVLSHDEMPEDLRWNTVCLWGGEKTHLVQYPLRRGELFNLVAVFHSDKFTEGWDAFGEPEELHQRFADKCEPVRRLLDKIESWRMWVLCDREPIRDWYRGRVVLLGDAAHPMLQYLAQGAAMAIEDAVCLSDMLVNTNGNIDAALPRYRDIRYLRTARVQLTARFYGDVYHASNATRDLRNDLLSKRQPEAAYAGMSWLYDTDPSWRDADHANPTAARP